uniref:Uncharacterized protein n=1 Tax=Rhizophora mucronata TaxID=61149 RepID=A0A2P2NZU2_RHIMU
MKLQSTQYQLRLIILSFNRKQTSERMVSSIKTITVMQFIIINHEAQVFCRQKFTWQY